MRILLGADAAASTPTSIADASREAERVGYDGISIPELAHDPALLAALVAGSTERVAVATGVMIAFARNPMTVAMQAADLQQISRGRLILGLGSQIRPHIEQRFSMAWSNPADRMRDFVSAMRAIWDAFDSRGRLRYRGRFYTHTLLTPMFTPDALPFGPPEVWVAAVGERMTAVAGEVGDAYVAHPFMTPDYLRERASRALMLGAERAERGTLPLRVASPLVGLLAEESERELVSARIRRQLAFYGSTPAYRPVMELHGWSDTADQLGSLSRRGRWEAMEELIDDDMLRAFAVIGDPSEAAAELISRYSDIADALVLGIPASTAGSLQDNLIRALRGV